MFRKARDLKSARGLGASTLTYVEGRHFRPRSPKSKSFLTSLAVSPSSDITFLYPSFRLSALWLRN
jgi:hypothetical protein